MNIGDIVEVTREESKWYRTRFQVTGVSGELIAGISIPSPLAVRCEAGYRLVFFMDGLRLVRRRQNFAAWYKEHS